MDLGGFLACGFALISLFFLQSISRIFQVNIVEACRSPHGPMWTKFGTTWVRPGPTKKAKPFLKYALREIRRVVRLFKFLVSKYET